MKGGQRARTDGSVTAGLVVFVDIGCVWFCVSTCLVLCCSTFLLRNVLTLYLGYESVK